MNTEKKKMNAYVKAALLMLAGVLAGAVLGFAGVMLFDFAEGSIKEGAGRMLEMFQILILPMMIAVTAVSVILGEYTLRKMKRIQEKLRTARDEDYERLDYEEEKAGGIGSVQNICSMALCFIILSFGYSTEYIGESSQNADYFLAACVVWLICYAHDGVWQIRMVKQIQKERPEMKADPVSRKFHQQWIGSCDEAEREIIYQSSYKTFILLNKCIPMLLVITMLLHLFFQTGVLAVIAVAVIWLLTNIRYVCSCVELRKRKIN